MFKKLLAFLAALSVFAAFAAVDVNKATEAEIDGIKGIGPATTRVIVAERQKAEFKSWEDFITRVKGVGPKSAAKFSADGLTVGGAPYQGGTTAPATKKSEKSTVASKADAVKPVAAAASAASAAKK